MTDEIASIRSITREDLSHLAQPRDRSVSMPQRLRNSHRDVARFLAIGWPTGKIAAITGYSTNRIAILASAPAMQELVAQFKARMDQAWDDAYDAYATYAVQNMIAAERQLSDRLDEADAEGETLPVRELVAITSDRADRFGYPKKSVATNVNVDFAAKLESAIARSRPKTIGALPQSAPGLILSPTPPAPAQSKIRRIA